MRVLGLLALACLLAGCSDGGPGPSGEPSATGTSGSATSTSPGEGRTSDNATSPVDPLLFDNRTFELTLDGASAGGPGSQHGLANCIILRPGATVAAGNLTLTWTSQSPLSDQLEAVVAVGSQWLQAGPGPSPLVVDLAGLADGRDRNTNFSVQFAGPGGGARLEVHADLRLQYRGTLDFQSVLAGCSYS